MVAVYTSTGHSCFLYLGSILVDEFASEPSCVPGLVEMLQALIPKAFDLLQQEDGLKQNPDTVDDLFRLCIRFLQRAPLPFLQSPALPSIIQCGIIACSLDHRDANASVMKFFYDLIHMGHSSRTDNVIKGLVEATLASFGEALCCALLHASALSLHAYMLGEVADVLLQLLAREGQADWLQTALQRLPAHAPCATPLQCAQFHSYALKAESSKEMTRLLRDFARLYR